MACNTSDDVEYGFKREEMYSSNLAGTAEAYDRHVYLCYKTPESWVTRLEDSVEDPLPKRFADALKACKNDIPFKTKLNVFEGKEHGFADGDVLVFPDMIVLRDVKESDVDTIVDEILVNSKTWTSGVQEPLNGSYTFVCAHASRDKRCGLCGPILIEKFKQEIELRKLDNNQVTVAASSHIGGHKYAGNIIIYSQDSQGKTVGHWYGYVTPQDVPELLDQHIGQGEIVERIWRGQLSQKFEGLKENITETEEKSTTEVQGNADGCCKGLNGVSCCKN